MRETLRLGHRSYDVRVVAKVDAQGARGETCHDKATIKIRSGCVPIETCDIALHETGHVIWDTFGLADDHKIDEEQFCRMLASGMLMACHQNPWLFEILAGRVPAAQS